MTPDYVSAAEGRIGLVRCPGIRYGSDPVSDLDALRAWGAAALVTLMEPQELHRFGFAALGARAEAMGLEWHHLAIRDMGAPDDLFEQRWTHTGPRLRRLLRDGKHIVLHCMAGLGRSGMIAARLLVELGGSPDNAIRSVRAARPGAIQSPAQEDHIGDCRPISLDDGLADRVLGCLLGGAVGDGFGYAVEFNSLASIQARYGAEGLTAPVYVDDRLLVSDDTQMTLFTLEGLLRGQAADPVGEIRLAYLDWLATQGMPYADWSPAGALHRERALNVGRAPGNTCLSALEVGGKGTPTHRKNDSKGCGGVMRVAPIGLDRSRSVEDVFDLAARAAAITHGHPTGFLSAGALAAIIRLLIDGADLREAAVVAMQLVNRDPECRETVELMDCALAFAADRSLSGGTAVRLLGEGWIAEQALAIGLYAALTERSFAAVLARAANHDGDSDSTASIAGQLYGAAHGLSDLPNAWVRRLDIYLPLLKLVSQLVSGRG